MKTIICFKLNINYYMIKFKNFLEKSINSFSYIFFSAQDEKKNRHVIFYYRREFLIFYNL